MLSVGNGAHRFEVGADGCTARWSPIWRLIEDGRVIRPVGSMADADDLQDGARPGRFVGGVRARFAFSEPSTPTTTRSSPWFLATGGPLLMVVFPHSRYSF